MKTTLNQHNPPEHIISLPFSLHSFIFTFTTATACRLDSPLKLYWSTNCSQNSHTSLSRERKKKKKNGEKNPHWCLYTLKLTGSKSHRVQQRDNTGHSVRTCCMQKPPSSKLCSTSSRLLFKFKGGDWVKAMTIESPHHSHKFASCKPHPVRERERERERETHTHTHTERERERGQIRKHWSFP